MNKDNLKKDIINSFNFRHATKEFDVSKKISDDDFNFILETARLSPSSFGFEPWHFIVVQDKDLREKIKPNAWGATAKLDTASHFIVTLAMKSSRTKWDSDYLKSFMQNVQKLPDNVVEGKTKFFKDFQKNDFKLDSDSKLFDWASKQTYIALANMMTSAALIGIDSCPIEGFNQEAIDDLLKEEFEVDTNIYGVSHMLALGYRAKEQSEKTRRYLSEIVSWK